MCIRDSCGCSRTFDHGFNIASPYSVEFVHEDEITMVSARMIMTTTDDGNEGYDEALLRCGGPTGPLRF